MTFKKIMELWTLITSITAINQIKTVGTFIFDKHFKGKQRSELGNTATLKIKTGASVVLESIAPGADRVGKDLGDIYEITIKFPRFGKSTPILAHEINMFETLKGEAKAEAVSQRIKEILKEDKNDYMTTYEYMATGALFGKVVDGAGKVLFEFRANAEPIEFKGKKITKVYDEIDQALVDELGHEVSYDIYASPEFMSSVADNAEADGLFKSNNASWKDEDSKRVLMVHGKKYIPFRGSWKDSEGNVKRHIAKGEAIVVPQDGDVFELVYGRADHTDALTQAPKLFFMAAPEPLGKGKGWSIETETKGIPYCKQPGALIRLKFSK